MNESFDDFLKKKMEKNPAASDGQYAPSHDPEKIKAVLEVSERLYQEEKKMRVEGREFDMTLWFEKAKKELDALPWDFIFKTAEDPDNAGDVQNASVYYCIQGHTLRLKKVNKDPKVKGSVVQVVSDITYYVTHDRKIFLEPRIGAFPVEAWSKEFFDLQNKGKLEEAAQVVSPLKLVISNAGKTAAIVGEGDIHYGYQIIEVVRK
jgi:hypothetical protein